MSFNIPGYFLDQKTKKLFKIQSHGRFSLKELQKRLREEEEEAAAVASVAASGSNSSSGGSKTHTKLRSPANITQFLRQRASLGSIHNSKANTCNSSGLINHSGIPFLMTQLKCRTKIDLEESQRYYNNMLVDLTSDPDYGEIIMSYSSGRMMRYGYQVNPGLQVWNAGQHWDGVPGEALSLQFGSRPFTLNGQQRRTIVGTSEGKLWRYSIPKLPSLTNEDLRRQFLLPNGSIRNDGHILGYPLTSYPDTSSGSTLDCLFSKKKDLFFSSSLDDENDHIVVGGDQALYQLTSDFELVGMQKIRSSIFSTHLPKGQPHLCWTGARNGTIQLVDFRQTYQNNLKMDPRFKQSSSITQIQMLDGYELLTTGMDGSINIWDTRQLKTGNKGNKSKYDNNRKRGYYKGGYKEHSQESNKLSEPIRSLKGHINESTQHLGFDVDLENNLLMLSGSDGKVRIWSIFSSNTNEPIWCSEKFPSPIPAVKFMLNENQYPRIQDGWSTVLERPTLLKNYPGILLFGVNNESNDSSSIQWLTGIK